MLREVATEHGMTAKSFIESIRHCEGSEVLTSSALRQSIAAYFRNSIPRYALVDQTQNGRFGLGNRARRKRERSKLRLIDDEPRRIAEFSLRFQDLARRRGTARKRRRAAQLISQGQRPGSAQYRSREASNLKSASCTGVFDADGSVHTRPRSYRVTRRRLSSGICYGQSKA
jgi:hypothetical protein